MIDINIDRERDGAELTIRVTNYNFDRGCPAYTNGDPGGWEPGEGPTARALDILEVLADKTTQEMEEPLTQEEWDTLDNRLLEALTEE